MLLPLRAVVLAAGNSSRFHTGTTKLVMTLCGKPMITYLASLLASIEVPTTYVVGQHAQDVLAVLTDFYHEVPTYVVQESPRGTGDALAIAQSHWDAETILVLNGDMPLLSRETIKNLVQMHHAEKNQVTFVTSHCTDPSSSGYGRVINENGRISIVEARHYGSTVSMNEHCCVNAGVYLFQRDFLLAHCSKIMQNSVSKEYYITDLIAIAQETGGTVGTIKAPFDEIRGVNTLQELWAAEHILRASLMKKWMQQGVRFINPSATYLDLEVTIGAGTVIGAGVSLLGKTSIGINCRVDGYSTITNSTIENDTHIFSHSIITDSIVESNCSIGPMSHIHSKSRIGQQSVIGNFVEVKNSLLGQKTKAKHLSYLGDVDGGNTVNIGAGTITSNHNGRMKNRTKLGNYAYIGSNVTLIAPVKINDYAFIAAGSTITHDVPADALAIARERQIIKNEYNKKLRPDLYSSLQQSEAKDPQELSDASLGNHPTPSLINQ